MYVPDPFLYTLSPFIHSRFDSVRRAQTQPTAPVSSKRSGDRLTMPSSDSVSPLLHMPLLAEPSPTPNPLLLT